MTIYKALSEKFAPYVAPGTLSFQNDQLVVHINDDAMRSVSKCFEELKNKDCTPKKKPPIAINLTHSLRTTSQETQKLATAIIGKKELLSLSASKLEKLQLWVKEHPQITFKMVGGGEKNAIDTGITLIYADLISDQATQLRKSLGLSIRRKKITARVFHSIIGQKPWNGDDISILDPTKNEAFSPESLSQRYSLLTEQLLSEQLHDAAKKRNLNEVWRLFRDALAIPYKESIDFVYREDPELGNLLAHRFNVCEEHRPAPLSFRPIQRISVALE